MNPENHPNAQTKRKRRAWYSTDFEYKKICLYCEAKGLSVSQFLRNCATGEINRHVKKNDLKALVIEILKDIGIRSFPARGEGPGGDSKGDIS